MSAESPAPLVGLVLAGGESRRMGTDKGALDWQGQPLVLHTRTLLEPFCRAVTVSVRADQARAEPYRDLPLVHDDPAIRGPAAGLLAAWAAEPGAALLVLAVDLPLVDPATLGHLVENRDPAQVATAFRHPNGSLEPLCAIWEPAAAGRLREAVGSRAGPSLRLILEAGPIAALSAPEPARLVSCNTPEALAGARATLGA